jgi:dihydrofolate reductase
VSSTRRVVGNIALSLDGRVNGTRGDADMSWIVPHAITDGARDQMVRVTSLATTALLGRKNYQGFASYWPPVAADESADPRDRTFAQWLDSGQREPDPEPAPGR